MKGCTARECLVQQPSMRQNCIAWPPFSCRESLSRAWSSRNVEKQTVAQRKQAMCACQELVASTKHCMHMPHMSSSRWSLASSVSNTVKKKFAPKYCVFSAGDHWATRLLHTKREYKCTGQLRSKDHACFCARFTTKGHDHSPSAKRVHVLMICGTKEKEAGLSA